MPLKPGTRLGTYERLALIGAGGMGEVHKAEDTKLNRIVASSFPGSGSAGWTFQGCQPWQVAGQPVLRVLTGAKGAP